MGIASPKNGEPLINLDLGTDIEDGRIRIASDGSLLDNASESNKLRENTSSIPNPLFKKSITIREGLKSATVRSTNKTVS